MAICDFCGLEAEPSERPFHELHEARARVADLEAALQQAQEERDRLKEPVPGDPNPCPRCGRRCGLCASVSSEDWFRITGHWNGGGHLCLWCMDALAAEKGLSGIHCTLSFAGRAIWSDDDLVEEACQARARGRLLWKQVIEEQTILRITTGYLLAAERDAKAQRALAEETVRLRDAVWAMQEWWRVSRDEIWAERKDTIEFILERVHQCIFCKKSLGPQENKSSQGEGWWGCWPPHASLAPRPSERADRRPTDGI